MIQHTNPQDTTGLDQPIGDLQIFTTWCWISARVIVDKNESSRGLPHRTSKHLTRMDKAGIKSALRDPGLPHDAVPAIEEQHHEMLLAAPSHALKKMTMHVFRAPYRGSSIQPTLG
jgi:hypothetical protein